MYSFKNGKTGQGFTGSQFHDGIADWIRDDDRRSTIVGSKGSNDCVWTWLGFLEKLDTNLGK